jgi:hypothetical protein
VPAHPTLPGEGIVDPSQNFDAALSIARYTYHSLNLASRKWETGVVRRKNRPEGMELRGGTKVLIERLQLSLERAASITLP